MKVIFTLIFLLSAFFSGEAQSFRTNPSAGNAYSSRQNNRHSNFNLNGQWRGSFKESTPNILGLVSDEKTTYVLELEMEGNAVGGYSYTYFSDLGDRKRYYTICRISGTYDPKDRKLVVTEIERLKFNTPPNIQNCFQIHTLYFERGDDNTEYLKGSWIPAPNQVCGGKGTTVLTRNVEEKSPFVMNSSREKATAKKPAEPIRKNPPVMASKEKKAIGSKKTEPEQKEKLETREITSQIPVEQPKDPVIKKEEKIDRPPLPSYSGYENRRNVIMQTIHVKNPSFQIELYDNGVIDGDSISVFYNGQLILSHQRLSDKPIKVTLTLDPKYRQNVITMYAENLGTIPPNTALMIVRDGDRRYEVRMESDLGKSGSVIFRHDDD